MGTVPERHRSLGKDVREVGSNNVRTNWVDVWLNANKDFPQTGIGIFSATSNEIITDIYNRKSGWNTLAHSRLDAMQMMRVKDLVAKLHTAFREEPWMPEGYSHPKSTVTIPDIRLQKLWNDLTSSAIAFSLVFSLWAERDLHTNLPPIKTDFKQDDQDENKILAYEPQDIERLNIFFKDRRYKRYVRALLRTTKAMRDSLETPEGRALGKKQRGQNNSRKPVEMIEASADRLLNDHVITAISREFDKISKKPFPYLFRRSLQVPHNFAETIRNVVATGEIPQSL